MGVSENQSKKHNHHGSHKHRVKGWIILWKICGKCTKICARMHIILCI